MQRTISRRAFLAQATVAAGTVPFATAAKPPRPIVGTQLYGWGQYYQREGRQLTAHLNEVLSTVRDAGFDYAETSLNVAEPEANTRLAGLMRSKGLKTVCLYSGGRLHEADKHEETVARLLSAAKAASAAGFSVLNCNPDPVGRDKSDTELATQTLALRKLGEGLKQLGMSLGVHNHTPEMKKGAKEYHSNLRNTPASSVGFCYDVHWVFRGGVPPADALRDYGSRIVSWHLRQSRDKIWWEDLDTGDIDYAAIAAHAKREQLPPVYTVELALEGGTKITRNVVENHRRSRDFVRRVFGA